MRRMMRLLLGLALLPALAWAEPPIQHPFRVATDPSFAPVVPTLRTLLAHGPRAATNHFCVIGQALDSGDRQAWVYWREGKALVLWEATVDGIGDLATSRRYLRFGRDVVAPDDPRLATSSYLVSRQWADSVIAECATEGTDYVVGRSGQAKDANR
jgi:hypothetical protein